LVRGRVQGQVGLGSDILPGEGAFAKVTRAQPGGIGEVRK